MTYPLAGYYDESLPPELWEAAPAAPPVMGAAAPSPEQTDTPAAAAAGEGQQAAAPGAPEVDGPVDSEVDDPSAQVNASSAAKAFGDESAPAPRRTSGKRGGRR